MHCGHFNRDYGKSRYSRNYIQNEGGENYLFSLYYLETHAGLSLSHTHRLRKGKVFWAGGTHTLWSLINLLNGADWPSLLIREGLPNDSAPAVYGLLTHYISLFLMAVWQLLYFYYSFFFSPHDPMHRETTDFFVDKHQQFRQPDRWTGTKKKKKKKCTCGDKYTKTIKPAHTHTHTQSALEGSGLGAHICWCSHKNSNKGRLFFSYLLFLRHVGCSLISPTWIKTLRPLPVAAKHTVGCCWMPFLFCPEL